MLKSLLIPEMRQLSPLHTRQGQTKQFIGDLVNVYNTRSDEK